MKIADKKSTLSTNSMSTESHEFKIGDVSAIIEILRNRLYSNPIRTLTQEYISNARDSHREAGVADKPIQVTLPTKVDSSLKIRDYGVGLSRQRVKDVFVNYGISTKQDSNEQTGGFGLGAKSAWAYSDSFTVTSFYDGEKSVYIAHTGKNKNGVFELISCEPTDEPNGVEVQVPVKESDINAFVNAVYRTTLFWEVKPIIKGITDIEIPKNYKNGGVKHYDSDSFAVIDASDDIQRILDNKDYYNSTKTFLLIDNIPYSLSGYQTGNVKTLCNLFSRNTLTFIKVDNGEIAVSASRESIAKEEDNVNKIQSLSQNCIKELTDYVVDSLSEKKDSLKDYYDNYLRLWEMVDLCYFPVESKNLFNFDYSIDGIKFSFDFDQRLTSDCFEHVTLFKLVKKRVLSRISRLTTTTIDYKKENIKIVVNDIVEESENNTNKRIRHLIETSGHRYVYLVKLLDLNEEQKETIFNTFNAVNLSDLEIPKKSYARSNSGYVKNKEQVTLRSVESVSSYDHTIKSGSMRTITLDDLTNEIEETNKLHILIPLKMTTKEIEEKEVAKYFTFLDRYKNAELIRCGINDMKKLVSLENDKIVTLETFASDVSGYCPILDEEFDWAFKEVYAGNICHLKNYRDKIICEFTQYLFDEYDKFDHDLVPTRNLSTNRFGTVFDEFLTEHYDNYVSVKEKHHHVKDMNSKFEEMYPLFRNAGYIREDEYEEYAYYINGRCSALGTNSPSEAEEAKKILDRMVNL